VTIADPHPQADAGTREDRFEFLVVSNRLPVEQRPDGAGLRWHNSPGGLVSALQPVIAKGGGAWVGWTGDVAGREGSERQGADGSERPGWPGLSLVPDWEDTGQVQVIGGESGQSAGGTDLGVDGEGVHAVPVSLSEEELDTYYEGFCNATLWPLYHDVIAPPVYSRRWWHSYVEVNQRFASVVAAHAAADATVWVHDYHLQLFPAMLRGLRADLRIGFFNHIPFPPFELFAQLPWRREVIEGLLGSDLIGFQTADGAANFLRACRRLTDHHTQGSLVQVVRRSGGPPRLARVGAFPISVDVAELSALARRPETIERARQIRQELGDPRVVLLGVDRLDYTKGLLHRLRAYGELLREGKLSPPDTVLVQVASPSRGEVEQYRRLREELERVVGSINGDFSPVGHPAVHYLHQSFPKQEMAAMYLAADVALVTPLRDGMNLVAKEYVACRYDNGGRLVLSEFTGAAKELAGAFIVNPHDIDAMKVQIMAAVEAGKSESTRRMRRMRQRLADHDVHRWAAEFLGALDCSFSESTGAH
jgi:trehalose 6-phosphate synthase